MKRFLRVRDYYAPAKDKLKHQYIRYISLLAVLTIMCLYAVKQVSAQVAEPAATAVADIKPLQIGDTIPEVLWDLPLQVVNHPEGRDTITLNDFRDRKLIILDFWAYTCSACIISVNKLRDCHKLPGAERVAFLPIHTKPAILTERMQTHVVKLISRQQWPFPVVFNNEKIDRFFVNEVPNWGTVWIYEGTFLAAPKTKYLAADTITKLLENQPIQFN